jgi:hypothetical protein
MAEQIEPTHAEIQKRAYELFEERGYEPGRELQDWLAAEQELRALAFENVIRTIVDRRRFAGNAKMPMHSQASAAGA